MGQAVSWLNTRREIVRNRSEEAEKAKATYPGQRVTGFGTLLFFTRARALALVVQMPLTRW